MREKRYAKGEKEHDQDICAVRTTKSREGKERGNNGRIIGAEEELYEKRASVLERRCA